MTTKANLNNQMTTKVNQKAELEKLLQSYKLTALDKKVIETWSGKTWMPQGLRDAASAYMQASKQTPSLVLLAVHILDTYGLLRDISRKARQDFLADFD